MKNQIETEYKLELSKEEFLGIKSNLDSKGVCLGIFELDDYFFDIKKSPIKNWDFTRVRVYGDDKYEKTVKKWEVNSAGEPIRNETESQSNKEELDLLLKSRKYLQLHKVRTDYKVIALGYEGVISLDEVSFPDEARYFIECELKNVTEEKSHSIRDDLKAWMLKEFNLSNRPEGKGMMTLVIEKSGKVFP